MKIDSSDRNIQQILSSNYYKVPRFQRPYSWDKDNVSEFWQDAIIDSEGDYFIGSLVVYKIQELLLGIVDGQQRLTTITMLLCALRNIFSEEDLGDQANGIQILVERPDINNKPQFVFQTETSYPYLQEYIQKQGKPEIKTIIKEEEKNLQIAYDFLTDKLHEIITHIRTNPLLNEENKKVTIKDDLISIRDKILGLKVIFISLDNEDDAYTIFETLNTRGKDLSLSDLIKGHLTKLVKPKNHNVDLSKDKWNQLSRIIEESSADLELDTFIYHEWLSKYEFLPAKRIYKAIKRTVKDEKDGTEFLDSILEDARIYREINEPLYRKWDKQELSIKNSLEALNFFRVKMPLPMLLAIMREYKFGTLNKKQVQEILESIENFHLIFTAVTSQRSSSGIAQMYANNARELISTNNIQEKILILSNLKNKLQERKPSLLEFEAGFTEIKYSDSYTKQKRLVQYILGKFAKKYSNGLPLDYDLLTIEHISAQRGIEKIPQEKIAKIGNLILIDHDLNNKLGNKSFLEKKKILLESNIFLDDFIKKTEIWNEEMIDERTRILAKIGYQEIWKI